MNSEKLIKRIFVLSNNNEDVTNIFSTIEKNVKIFFGHEIQRNNYDLIVLYDYNENLPYDYIKNNNIIRVHKSLLPSFNTQTPIKDAYISGVKVTGVTVHKVENEDLTGMILAQYPVIIDNYTHYDQLKSELRELASKLTPLVIKSILEDKVFDIVDFLHTPHSCGGCSGCKSCNK